MREREGDVVKLGIKLKKSLNVKNLTITQGQSGAILINKNNKVFRAPAFCK